jgi:succinyl-CoA synthetase beta subunit
VSLKVCSPDIVHKSDIGGVQLNVTGDAAVHRGFEEVTAAGSAAPGARIEGVLVSPMRPQAVELLVGVAQDPQWGPVLAVAAGGIFVEVVHDSALAPLPVTPVRARRLVGGLRAAPLFAGARGRAPVDLDGLSAVISRIGDLALALGDRLESLEVNPLRVDGSRIEALDAVVTWRDAPPSSTPSGHDPEGAR